MCEVDGVCESWLDKYENSESFRYGDMKAHKRHLKYIRNSSTRITIL